MSVVQDQRMERARASSVLLGNRVVEAGIWGKNKNQSEMLIQGMNKAAVATEPPNNILRLLLLDKRQQLLARRCFHFTLLFAPSMSLLLPPHTHTPQLMHRGGEPVWSSCKWVLFHCLLESSEGCFISPGCSQHPLI